MIHMSDISRQKVQEESRVRRICSHCLIAAIVTSLYYSDIFQNNAVFNVIDESKILVKLTPYVFIEEPT